jgi:predicted nucleotidyltransferase
MDIEDMEAAVAKWASAQPLVRKAYLFGSRVRRTYRSDSDLDVAVEIFPSPGDSEPLATWMRESRHLEASIAGIVPVIIDLEWYGGEDDTPVIHKALERSSLVVYEDSA